MARNYLGSRADFMGNYPPGAAHDPRAPYNEVEPPERTFAVKVDVGISRTVDVVSTDYDDTELLQPQEDYENTYMPVRDIFTFAIECARRALDRCDYSLGSRWHLQNVIDSATGWQQDSIDVEQ